MGTYNNVKTEIGNIIIKIGDNFDLSLLVYSKDDNGVLTPYDLNGKTVRCEVRSEKDGDVDLLMVSPDDITIEGDDDNQVTFDKTITELSEGSYYYDMQVDEDDYTFREGKMIARVQITDD